MPFIETNDKTSIYYKDWGSGRPVVLIHGWPVNAEMWEYQQAALAEAGYRVVAYDRRGFGRSSQPWSGYDYDTMASDLATLMDTLDLRDATLVGFSMGGGEVARYMSKYGAQGRVRSTVLVGAVTPFLLKTDDNPDGVPQEVFDGIVRGIKEDRPAFFRTFAKSFFGVSVIKHPVSAEILEWNQMLTLMASPRATTECVHAWSSTDFRADLKALKVPTLIIHGDSDQTVPKAVSADKAAKLVPHAQVKIYEGGPHGLYVSHKEQLNADLLGFLKS